MNDLQTNTQFFVRIAAVLKLSLLLVAGQAIAADGAAGARSSAFITLGTNSGPIPNPDRAEASNVLIYGDQVIVIDAGDAVAWQLSKAGVGLDKVNTVFLSHLHFDHTGGLFALLSQRFQVNAQGVVTIYGPEGTKETVAGLVQAMLPVTADNGWMLSRIQPEPAETVEVVELTHGSEIALGDVRVAVSRNSHYILVEEEGDTQVRGLSFRFDLPDRSIVYTGDTGPSDDVIVLSQGADMLVTEIMDAEVSYELLQDRVAATDPGLLQSVAIKFAGSALKKHFDRQHLSPEEVGDMAQRAKVKSLVVTHNALPDELLDEAKKRIAAIYKGPVSFASDLQAF